MGWRLAEEMQDTAPACLSSSQRLLLVVVAHFANDATRKAWPGMSKLMRRMGVTEDAVKKVLRSLAVDHGCEIRVVVSVGRDGRPIFAHEGQCTVYRLPLFAERDDERVAVASGKHARSCPVALASRGESLPVSEDRERRDDRPASRGAEGGKSSLRGGKLGRQRGEEFPALKVKEPSGTTAAARRREDFPASTTAPQLPTAAARIVMDAAGVDVELATAVADRIAEQRRPDSLPAFVRHLVNAGELGGYVDHVLADRQRADVRAVCARASSEPECPHRQPGGLTLHPVSGEPLCASCRAEARANHHTTGKPEPGQPSDAQEGSAA